VADETAADVTERFKLGSVEATEPPSDAGDEPDPTVVAAPDVAPDARADAPTDIAPDTVDDADPGSAAEDELAEDP
jgi:hypothetical protein